MSPRTSLLIVSIFSWLTASAAYSQIIPSDAGLAVIDWKDARHYVDKQVIVQGTITATRNIGSITFLNFDPGRTFTAIVRKAAYKDFPAPPHVLYKGKIVRIRGTVTLYKGKPQIEITKPDQVQILESELPIASSQPASTQPEAGRPAFDGTVTIACFNMLNLFDEYDDPYHDDEGTPAKPKAEMERVAALIKSIDADVLALEEVENRFYLERFVRAMLPEMGYEHVVSYESNDMRGIECSVLSRLPVGPVTSYRHLLFDDGEGGLMSFRRDLLQVRLEPEGFEWFDVFVVHYKSKRGAGDATEAERLAECRQTRRIFDHMLADRPDRRFLICGDFNDTFDSRPLKALRGEGPTALVDFLADLPPRTVTYNKTHLSMIDFIFCSPALAKDYVPKTYHIPQGSVETNGSDHNPVVIKLKLPPARMTPP